MGIYSIPKEMQAVLWSVDVSHLEIEKDKRYIIHQMLSYGRMEDFKWVFRVYPKEEIIKVFTTFPYKDYTQSRFYFVKNFLLSLRNKSLNEKYYVKNIPRDIR